MKHAREDYNPIQDPRGLIPEDEPVMLFRAQDKHLPDILLRYLSLLHQDGNPDERLLELVGDHLQAVRKWQSKHKPKKPDLPISLEG